MKDKYEISIWEDFIKEKYSDLPREQKLCIIGSDTMTTNMRAVEPKMISNANGTNNFSFKMYQNYIDEVTGEKVLNPFLDLLINERKIKVFWKDQWYDMLIKNIVENTTDHSITYTCEDLFITELSRNGYNLEFSSDLQNNIGTASELAKQVLAGSDWSFDNTSTAIYEKTEEPVYQVQVGHSFNAYYDVNVSEIETKNIQAGKNILVFYSQTLKGDGEYKVQFYYTDDEKFKTDEGEMLVTNGQCYWATFNVQFVDKLIKFYQSVNLIFQINLNNGVSGLYRAERNVESQKTKFEPLLGRYVNLYKEQNTNKDICGYTNIEFSDPMEVVNLIVNPSNFVDTSGWIGTDLTLEQNIYPRFNSDSDVATYNTKSYLKVSQLESNEGSVYNYALSANQQYLTPNDVDIKNGNLGGFHCGEQYIFRIKFGRLNNNEIEYIDSDTKIVPEIVEHNNENNQYFNRTNYRYLNNWNEFTLTCIRDCAAANIPNLDLLLQINFDNSDTLYWIEEVQFFKLIKDENDNIIEPSSIIQASTESKTIYKYYSADDASEWASIDDFEYLYIGETENSNYIPQMTYEKLTSIEAKNSNRFNILQSIAENFKCWVRFEIEHDDNGKIKLEEDNGEYKQVKKVKLVDNIGEDLGWNFEYGIDLKAIQRKIISNQLSTKVIVIPNDNEFGKNGFCTIARSPLNFSRDNFILNFDYYINQGLLDRNAIQQDLYNPASEYIGYYYYLNQYNKEYDGLTDTITRQQMELTKRQSQLTVLQNQLKSSEEKKNSCESDLMNLAAVNSWSAVTNYAQTHTDNKKVQSLLKAHSEIEKTITTLDNQIGDNTKGLIKLVNDLKETIKNSLNRQKVLLGLINEKHITFYKKYSRYIQEGTWQDNNYIDDDKYYLDALEVAYTSSRPQIQYDINIVRLTSLEDFSSKTFNVGDICYIRDKEFFGANYNLKIVISEITSYFDEPHKDIIKVQNYKTQFDDLFQRITATTQSLQYAQGSYDRAAGMITSDRILSFSLLQDTFAVNENWVLNASNQQVTWDSTGVTITDETNAALKLRLMAGGVFITNDGGNSWKNAIRGDGISADVLTAGRINTGEIYVYDGSHPAFRWDSNGLTAYSVENNGTHFDKFVRHDQYGFYGYDNSALESTVPSTQYVDFFPNNEDDIWDNARFGFTWKGFFMKSTDSTSSVIISSDGDGIDTHLPSGATTKDKAVILVKERGNNVFYITQHGGAYFSGSIEACGKIYCTSEDGQYGLIKDTNSWLEMDSGGLVLKVNQDISHPDLTKIQLGYTKDDDHNYTEPYLQLGAGGGDTDGAGLIKKGQYGLYIGEYGIIMPSNQNGKPQGSQSTVNNARGGIYIETSQDKDDRAWANQPTCTILISDTGASIDWNFNNYEWSPIVTWDIIETLVEKLNEYISSKSSEVTTDVVQLTTKSGIGAINGVGVNNPDGSKQSVDSSANSTMKDKATSIVTAISSGIVSATTAKARAQGKT